jgi:hypothetical protein
VKILAFTDRRYAKATRKVTGWDADIVACPPFMAADIESFWLESYDFLYLDLHGLKGSVRLWSGPQLWAALDIKTVKGANLAGTIVFATSCFLPETRFIEAFLASGATCLVSGKGENYGTRAGINGAQKLAKLFIDGLQQGKAPALALSTAKKRLRRSVSRLLYPKATKDALQFHLWESNSDH